MNKFKFTKVNEDTYDVTLDGAFIGRVTKSWHRNGGSGWSTPGLSHQLGKTREKAALNLYRKQNQIGKPLIEVLK